MPENPSPALSATQTNESIPASQDSFENSRFEKIVSAGERVFAKFGIVKPGRGRPRKDGQPKKSDVVAPAENQPATPGGNPVLPGVAPLRPEIDTMRVKLFVAGCVGVLKGAVGFVKKWVGRQATAARIDPAFTSKALAECSPDEAAFKRWGDALEVCATQYNWDFEHMPAVTLGVETVSMFAPFLSLADEFKKEIARNRAKDEMNASVKNGGVK